jgi:hypothetical protein
MNSEQRILLLLKKTEQELKDNWTMGTGDEDLTLPKMATFIDRQSDAPEQSNPDSLKVALAPPRAIDFLI